MTRSRPGSSDQTLPACLALWLCRACASLRLAVVLIALCAIVLAWATIVESHFGDRSKAAHYGFYGGWWFLALNTLLGLNVLAAVLRRFPWKEYSAGLLKPFPGWLILGSLFLMLSLLFAAILGLLCQRLFGHHFGPQATWWFLLLGTWLVRGLVVLAGVNVLYAMGVHIWWKRHQTGFLITHAGILILLVGALLTHRGGIDAHLSVFEDQAAWRAFQDSQSLKLVIYPEEARQNPQKTGNSLLPVGANSAPEPETITIPFVAGPFNWDDYDYMFPFPWCLARRDRGVVYDRDRIKLEVLDYYSDSQEIAVPRLRLRSRSGASPGRSLSDEPGESIELAIESSRGVQSAGRRDLSTGQRLVFWMADSEAETRAFRHSGPRGALGPQGQIVLHAGGQSFHLPVDSFQQQQRQPLGDTGLELELVQSVSNPVAVLLQIHHQQDPPQRMVLLAEFPDRNYHDRPHGVFGSYWFDPRQQVADDGDQPRDARTPGSAPRPRIDILQGTDGTLYYRTWRAPTVGPIARLPTDGTEVAAFQGTSDAVAISVEEFIASERPQIKILPVAFERDKSPAEKQRRARLRLSVDGTRREFWLAGLPLGMTEISTLPSAYRRVLQGKDRRVAVSMPYDEIDVGFQVFLHKFSRKLDPGSSAVSHYSSLVDFCDRRDQDKLLQKKVLITLNAPVNFSDPRSGRSYRLYQSSYKGPLKPGDPQFEQLVGGKQRRDRLFQSFLAVNYDPGRGLKYLGCLLICAGILITFYMRTYLSRNRSSPEP